MRSTRDIGDGCTVDIKLRAVLGVLEVVKTVVEPTSSGAVPPDMMYEVCTCSFSTRFSAGAVNVAGLAPPGHATFSARVVNRRIYPPGTPRIGGISKV